MTLSASGKQETLKQETSAAFIHLLEIFLNGATTPIRICDNPKGITHLGNLYSPLGFEVKLSSEARNSLPSATLDISNISREITQELILANPFNPIKCNLMLISSFELNEVQNRQTFFLKSAVINREKLRCQISYNDTMNQRFPDSTMNSVDFKAIE